MSGLSNYYSISYIDHLSSRIGGHFNYQHINIDGELKTGTCDSEPKLEDGKLRYYEKWRWSTGETGESVIEEL